MKILSAKQVASLFVLSVASAWAEGPAVPAGGSAGVPGAGAMAPQSAALMNLVPFLLMFVVIYFLMIRPQQKRMKEHQQMLTALKEGDEVVTTSGILGKIAGLSEKVITVEIADKVRVKMLKSQISQVVKGQVQDLS
jgi:preprotein translocase subunit YajC